MKLELEHLSFYENNGIKVLIKCEAEPRIGTFIEIESFGGLPHLLCINENGQMGLYDLIQSEKEYTKLILHPFDIITEININGVLKTPYVELGLNYVYALRCYKEDLTAKEKSKLAKMGMDVFGLIPSGLAIDINTL